MVKLPRGNKVSSASAMVAASQERMCMTARKYSFVCPFTTHWQHIESSYYLLTSSHSSARMEKNRVFFKLSTTSFHSNQVSVVSMRDITANLDVYYAFAGPCVLCICRSLCHVLLNELIVICNLKSQ